MKRREFENINYLYIIFLFFKFIFIYFIYSEFLFDFRINYMKNAIPVLLISHA